MKQISKWHIFLLIVGGFFIATSTLWPYIFYFLRSGPITHSHQNWGLMGDFVGGATAPVIGLLTLVGLAFTVYYSRAAYLNTKEELEIAQREADSREQFERMRMILQHLNLSAEKVSRAKVALFDNLPDHIRNTRDGYDLIQSPDNSDHRVNMINWTERLLFDLDYIAAVDVKNPLRYTMTHTLLAPFDHWIKLLQMVDAKSDKKTLEQLVALRNRLKNHRDGGWNAMRGDVDLPEEEDINKR
jgi:hypothetical protein